jgi:hypothetical protein
MGRDLEAPCPPGSSDWDELYRARGDEVVTYRPLFTGDVCDHTPVITPDGQEHTKTVMVVQHPCALRTNGIDLVSRLLVAEVRRHRVIPSADWTKFIKLMPLPDLVPTVDTGMRHRAAFLSELYLADPSKLGPRLACLSPLGGELVVAALGPPEQSCCSRGPPVQRGHLRALRGSRPHRRLVPRAHWGRPNPARGNDGVPRLAAPAAQRGWATASTLARRSPAPRFGSPGSSRTCSFAAPIVIPRATGARVWAAREGPRLTRGPAHPTSGLTAHLAFDATASSHPWLRPRRRSSGSATSSERGSCEPRCRTLLEYWHERGPLRRAKRASDQGGDTGNRTPDLLLAKQALYQLSYVPEGVSL